MAFVNYYRGAWSSGVAAGTSADPLGDTSTYKLRNTVEHNGDVWIYISTTAGSTEEPGTNPSSTVWERYTVTADNYVNSGSVSGTTLTLRRTGGLSDVVITGLPSGGGGGGPADPMLSPTTRMQNRFSTNTSFTSTLTLGRDAMNATIDPASANPVTTSTSGASVSLTGSGNTRTVNITTASAPTTANVATSITYTDSATPTAGTFSFTFTAIPFAPYYWSAVGTAPADNSSFTTDSAGDITNYSASSDALNQGDRVTLTGTSGRTTGVILYLRTLTPRWHDNFSNVTPSETRNVTIDGVNYTAAIFNDLHVGQSLRLIEGGI